MFADDMTIYVENPKESTRKSLELISDRSNVTGHRWSPLWSCRLCLLIGAQACQGEQGAGAPTFLMVTCKGMALGSLGKTTLGCKTDKGLLKRFTSGKASERIHKDKFSTINAVRRAFRGPASGRSLPRF